MSSSGDPGKADLLNDSESNNHLIDQITRQQLDQILAEHEQKNITHEGEPELKTDEERIFAHTLQVMNLSGIPYAVGAAFARNIYTGIWRGTKDLDIFLEARHLPAAMRMLAAAGYRTEIELDPWLAKAFAGDSMIDLIFASGHGQLVVDRSWIERSQPSRVLGVPSRLLAVEEMIAMACFVATRHRFDGAEVAHLIRGTQGQLEWERIMRLLGENRQLLLGHLIFFDYIYPGHSDYLPKDLMQQLFDEMRRNWADPPQDPKAFRGMLLDPFSFMVDVEDWGYEDRRKLAALLDENAGDILRPRPKAEDADLHSGESL